MAEEGQQTATQLADEDQVILDAFNEGELEPTGTPTNQEGEPATEPAEGQTQEEGVANAQTEPAQQEGGQGESTEKPPTIEELMARVHFLEKKYDQQNAYNKNRIDQAFGYLGSFKQEIKKKGAVQAPPTIKLKIEDFPELEGDFPNVREHFVTGYNRAVERHYQPSLAAPPPGTTTPIVEPQFQGQPPQTAPQVQPQAQPQPGVYPDPALQYQQGGQPSAGPTDEFEAYNPEQIIASHEMDAAVNQMELMIPGWREILGAESSQTPFRQWIATQPADYSEFVMGTKNPQVMAGAMQRFFAYEQQASQQQTQPQGQLQQPPAQPQTQRFAAAAQPVGTGTNPPPKQAKSEEDIILNAYNNT